MADVHVHRFAEKDLHLNRLTAEEIQRYFLNGDICCAKLVILLPQFFLTQLAFQAQLSDLRFQAKLAFLAAAGVCHSPTRRAQPDEAFELGLAPVLANLQQFAICPFPEIPTQLAGDCWIGKTTGSPQMSGQGCRREAEGIPLPQTTGPQGLECLGSTSPAELQQAPVEFHLWLCSDMRGVAAAERPGHYGVSKC